MADLKPCPFCGSQPLIERKGSWWYIGCGNPNNGVNKAPCYLLFNEAWGTEEEANRIWNRRV